MPARPWSRLLTAALAAAVALGTLGAPPASAGSGGAGAARSDVAVPVSPNGRYLVQYAPGADVAAEARSLRSAGVSVRRTFGRSFNIAVVQATRAEAAGLFRNPEVLAVEPDAVVTAFDSQVSPPWGLDRVDQRALPLSKSYTAPASGQGVKVYVVDTGVLAAHAEFGGRVAKGWSPIDDGLGSTDCEGHGTHVAGTVAGNIYGVAKKASIVPVRVLDCDGRGYVSDIVAGLDWVVMHHQPDQPAVVNMSLGGDPSESLDTAVGDLINLGITVIVAAGNAGTDACNASPARVPGAVTVAASDKYDQHASWSNHGNCVDLHAPGVGIDSASHTSTTAVESMSGTSMASPHVAGVAALLLDQQPDLSPTEVVGLLLATSTVGSVVDEPAGTPDRLLHVVPGAVSEPTEPVATKPSRPGKPTAAARRRAAVVRWVQGHDGGSEITRQIVRVYRGTKRVADLGVPGHVTGIRVKGLRAGKVYRFSVIMRNALGNSPESAKSNKVRPRR